MHRFKRILVRSLAVVISLAAVLYVCDDLWARYRGKPVSMVKVDHYYSMMNRWNELEYSVGSPEMQPCIHALFPHFGDVPCWYLYRHTLQLVHVT